MVKSKKRIDKQQKRQAKKEAKQKRTMILVVAAIGFVILVYGLAQLSSFWGMWEPYRGVIPIGGGTFVDMTVGMWTALVIGVIASLFGGLTVVFSVLGTRDDEAWDTIKRLTKT